MKIFLPKDCWRWSSIWLDCQISQSTGWQNRWRSWSYFHFANLHISPLEPGQVFWKLNQIEVYW